MHLPLARKLARSAIAIAATAWITLVASGAAFGQAYPAGPIRVVAPFPAGGAADLIARTLGRELSDAWKQPVLVENLPGAGGNIGTEQVAKSVPDGHTLLLATVTHAINVSLYPKIGYDPVKDFAPVILAATTPLVLVVGAPAPVRSLREFTEHVRARAGQLTYASAGSGTLQHLGMELLKASAGLALTHVPYKGSPPAMTDLVAGHVFSMLSDLPTALGNIRAGKVRALAVTGAARSAALPEVPTMAAEGAANLDFGVWMGVFAPARVPRDAVAKLNRELVRILALPSVGEAMARSGAAPLGGTPAEFEAFLAADVARWARVIRESNIRVD